MKHIHEIRDPIHVFVRLDTGERSVLDSRPFQRLRHIHQLALSYLLYPGATQKRFEHSLGVMELASRVFDVITHPDAIHPRIRQLLPEMTDLDALRYWRRVLRMAALCHDLGHLPFSHGAEKALLPEGCAHEDLSGAFIDSEEMSRIWTSLTPPLRKEDITKLALGPRHLRNIQFTNWETILAEIIVGNVFGVDRMDYLLRDSYHAGVAYGRFDHYRLIDTLRILPGSQESEEPALGVEDGGLHSAEALLLARYFMYKQVYFHPVRRIYDIHLKDFLKLWLPTGMFPAIPTELLRYSDVEVNAGVREASLDPSRPGHEAADRIVCRKHFKVAYSRNPDDLRRHPEPGRVIYEALRGRYEDCNVCRDSYIEKGGITDFPVLDRNERIVSSLTMSEALKNTLLVAVDYVFVEPSLRDESRKWLEQNGDAILAEAANVEE